MHIEKSFWISFFKNENEVFSTQDGTKRHVVTTCRRTRPWLVKSVDLYGLISHIALRISLLPISTKPWVNEFRPTFSQRVENFTVVKPQNIRPYSFVPRPSSYINKLRHIHPTTSHSLKSLATPWTFFLCQWSSPNKGLSLIYLAIWKLKVVAQLDCVILKIQSHHLLLL